MKGEINVPWLKMNDSHGNEQNEVFHSPHRRCSSSSVQKMNRLSASGIRLKHRLRLRTWNKTEQPTGSYNIKISSKFLTRIRC